MRSTGFGKFAKAEQKVQFWWTAAVTDLKLQVQNPVSFGQESEGGLSSSNSQCGPAGQPEVVLSSEEMRASRQGPCVLHRTKATPKETKVGKCQKSLKGLGFPYALCLNRRIQEQF